MIRNKIPVTHWGNSTQVVSQEAVMEAVLLDINVNSL